MILFVDQTGQLGGAELCLADIAAHFRDRSRVILLSDGPFVELLRQKGVEVDVLPLPASMAKVTKKSSPFELLTFLPDAARHLLALRRAMRNCRLVYLNTAKALLEGSLAKTALPARGVFHLHDIWDEAHFSRNGIRLMVAAANRMDAVIANSEATAHAYRAAGGSSTVHVIPNGIDPAPFDAVDDAAIQAIRAELNPEGRPVAAIFGRIARWKGQEILLRAAAEVPSLMVWVIGDALFTGDDSDYFAQLKELAEEPPLRGRVRFLGFRRDVPLLMRAADIVVHASVAAEPFGRVVVEGMLARKPVIAARAGGPAEIITDGSTGVLTEPGDALALADPLRRLAETPCLREEMGQRGRTDAMARYSLPIVLEKTAAVLSSLNP